MANNPRSINKKIGLIGAQTPLAVAKDINASIGKNLNLGTTVAPLRESGSTLPPLTIKKGA